jgi:hypothetical protein
MWQLVSFKNNTALPSHHGYYIYLDRWNQDFIFGFRCFVFIYRYLVAVFNFISNGKYLNYGYIIFGLFVALFLYIASKSILNEYGGALPKIGLAHKNFFYLDFYFFTKTKR